MTSWYVHYELDEESLTAVIIEIGVTATGTRTSREYTWVKHVITTDELGAYAAFCKWFEEYHPLFKLKMQGAKTDG